jgi:surfactin synthase thioesterase subunit
MADAELRAELAAVIRSRGIEPRPDMIEIGLFVLQGDLGAARGYRRPEPVRLGCPVVVLHWQDDPDVSLHQLQGWREYAASVTFEVLGGGRHDFADAPGELQRILTGVPRRPAARAEPGGQG